MPSRVIASVANYFIPIKTKNPSLALLIAAGLISFASSASASSYAPLLTQNTVSSGTSITGIGNYFGGSVTANVTANNYLGVQPWSYTYIDDFTILSIGNDYTTWTFSSTITEFTLGWAADSSVLGFNYEVGSTMGGSIASGTISAISNNPGAESFLHYFNPAGFNTVTISTDKVQSYGLGYGTGIIPEPSTYGLIGIAALGVAFAARRKKQKSV